MRPNPLLAAIVAPSLLLLAGCAGGPGAGDLSSVGRSPDGALRLQIALDRAGFTPGKLDGQLGEFTRKAAAEFHAARGHSPLDLRFPDTIRGVNRVHATYTIGPGDVQQVGDMPETHEEQAKRQSLPYTSLVEFVAERFHSSRAFLAALNPGLDMRRLAPGVTLTVPNVVPFEIESMPRGVAVPPAPERAGRDGEGGNGAVALAHPQDAQSRVDLHPSPGPNSPVGILWAGLDKSGIGIHGTSAPESIGRSTSHGCIRLANWDAIRFSRLVNTGAQVDIDVAPSTGAAIAQAASPRRSATPSPQ